MINHACCTQHHVLSEAHELIHPEDCKHCEYGARTTNKDEDVTQLINRNMDTHTHTRKYTSQIIIHYQVVPATIDQT